MPIVAPGSDWDTNNCIKSAGYTWCQILNKCVRLWEELCEYPTNCLTWNDGCNICQLNDGVIGACTEMYCFTNNIPYCAVQIPEMVIDPMPAVINPFVNHGTNGH